MLATLLVTGLERLIRTSLIPRTIVHLGWNPKSAEQFCDNFQQAFRTDEQ
jgi:hypothetical protein